MFNKFVIYKWLSFVCFLFLSLLQNGCFGDADIDRLKLSDSYINGIQVQATAGTSPHVFSVLVGLFVIDCLCAVNLLQYRMVDPAHGSLEESYTPDDDRQEVHSVFSEEGTGRRSDLVGVSVKLLFSDPSQVNGNMKKIATELAQLFDFR